LFNLGHAPLVKVGLVKIGPSRYIIANNFHHIIFDGFSLGILGSELIVLYSGERLPRLKIQYKDYAVWQNSGSRKEILKNQEKYWFKEFSGELPVLNLPTDYTRPEMIRFDGDRLRFKIDMMETGAINLLAFEERATLFMILLAFYTVFLSKITGQEDIVVGTSAACRRHENLLDIIGMFVNSLAMRNYPAGEKTFREFLKEVRSRTMEAFANQDFQFEDLVNNIIHTRDNSRNPIFDVMFVLNNETIPEWKITGMKLSHYEHEDLSAQMDLKLRGWEREGEILFCFEYSTRLFKKETIEMFIKNFKEVISIVLENRDIKLKDIRISHGLLSTEFNLLKEEQGDFVF
jgi:hypothetical protein